jgi:hypothetical protein
VGDGQEKGALRGGVQSFSSDVVDGYEAFLNWQTLMCTNAENYKIKPIEKLIWGWAWQCTSVIPATPETGVGGSWSKTGPCGKV